MVLVGEINAYRNLQVWQISMVLAESCYALTKSFPKDEIYGMASQIRRAAVSVAANIVEGHGRELTGLFIQFLRTSQGSLKELETHLMLAERVGLTLRDNSAPVLGQCDEIGKKLRSLIRALEARKDN
jgi:four helix bundle protein